MKRKLIKLLRKLPNNVKINVSIDETIAPLEQISVSINEQNQWTLKLSAKSAKVIDKAQNN